MRIRPHFAALLLMACASTTAGGARIADIDATGAAECEYVGDISESQYSGMLFAGSGLDGARAKVRNRAAKLGATHVAWGAMAAGGAVQAASAKAYRCPTGPAS